MSLLSEPTATGALRQPHVAYPVQGDLQSRHSRRLLPSPNLEPDELSQLLLPDGCDLIANTFIIFKWQNQCCILQANLTLYCWGGRRSGALEHVLERYGWTHSSQLHRINSKLVSPEQWLWLKQIFVTVHRMFDERKPVIQ